MGQQQEPTARRRRMISWIVVAAVACAALGGWAGSTVGAGQLGMIALIAATCGVLGSFLPGGVSRVAGRVRRSPGGQRNGIAGR